MQTAQMVGPSSPLPSVSVLIPTYNRASFLPDTLRSVFDQTLPVYEVIVVDDGSTDDTPAVLEGLLRINRSWRDKLRYVHQANQGKSVALNRGLEIASGDWIAYLDSDDSWVPTKLAWQFAALEKFPTCQACFTESSLMEVSAARRREPNRFRAGDNSFGLVTEPSSLFLVSGRHGGWPGIYMQSVVVERGTMRRCGEFDPRLRTEQDVDFLFRLGLETDFCYIDLPLLQINRDPSRSVGLMTQHPVGSVARLLARVARLAKWRTQVGDDPTLHRAVAVELEWHRRELVARLLADGDRQSARNVLEQALAERFSAKTVIKIALTWLPSRSDLRRHVADGHVESETE